MSQVSSTSIQVTADHINETELVVPLTERKDVVIDAHSGGVQSEVQTKLRLDAEKRLFYWNIAMMSLHLGQAIVVLALGLSSEKLKIFKIPMTTSFTDWSKGYPKPELQIRGYMPFVAVNSGFAWMSAAAHCCVLIFFKQYIADLRLGRNLFRWYEYAFSSSLMIALIGQLFGIYDVITLVLIMGINACMNLFGLLMETMNTGRKAAELDWTPFGYGIFAAIFPWACIFAYIGGGQTSDSKVPGFVWGILAAYIFFFQTFAVNMVLQYKRIGRWSDAAAGYLGGGYIFGEKVYQILSLVAKSMLLWLVVGGSNQPNEFTGVLVNGR